MDVTNTNNGKITWKLLKPIIQGKILFGPFNDDTMDIVSHSNKTFEDMSRLRELFRSLETSVKMLKTNKAFRANFDNLLNLAKSPFVQAILGGTVDIQTIENVLDSIINDKRVVEIIETIGNIFDCFSVDRFIPVKDEKELEDVAYELAKKKLFYASFFFNSDGSTNETSYTLRMEVDNSPVTIENKNRFWFPGPEGSFELEMRYHRGFIEIQNSVDTGIIKHKKKKQFEASNKAENSDDLDFSDLEFDDKKTDDHKNSSTEDITEGDDDFGGLKLDANGEFDDDNKTTSTTTSTTQSPDINFGDIFKTLQGKINISSSDVDKFADDGDYWDFDADDSFSQTTTNEPTTEETATKLSRKKRQFDSLLSMFGLGGGSSAALKKEVQFEVDDMTFYTKQFPYPKHIRDDFKKGL